MRTQVYGVFRTNGFRLRDAGEAGTQHGIFPTVSRVNHSCLPTCFVEFDSTSAVSLGFFASTAVVLWTCAALTCKLK